MSVTFNIFVCLNSGSVWELYLLAVNILTARFCIRFSRFACCCIRIQQQGAMCKTSIKSAIMVWPTIQLHGCQNALLCRFITRGHSTTVYGVVTYVNTLSSDASINIDAIIHLYTICVAFSNDLCTSDICTRLYLWM